MKTRHLVSGIAAAAPAKAGTVYTWDIATDQIIWNASAGDLPSAAYAASGALNERQTDPSLCAGRAHALSKQNGKAGSEGEAFLLRYQLRVGGRAIWIEDHGRSFRDPAGHISLVRGMVRRLPAMSDGEGAALISRDAVTRCLGPEAFLARVEKASALTKSGGEQFALLVLRISGLSGINRDKGFAAGNDWLRMAARVLRGAVRQSDSIARLGGDTFGLLLGASGRSAIPALVERINRAFHQPQGAAAGMKVLIAGRPLSGKSNVSSQIAALRTGLDSGSEAANRASNILPMNSHAAPDSALALLDALNERRLMLAFQPIHACAERRAALHEGLIRVVTTGRSVASNTEAIVALAERLGIIHLVDIRALELAFAAVTAGGHGTISINASASSLLNADWIAAFEALSRHAPGVAQNLIVEMTESRPVRDMQGLKSIFKRIRAQGARIAVDDFGSGHTSIGILRALRPDIVKIDGVLVDGIASDAMRRNFLRVLIDTIRQSGALIVAEWVRDQETASILEALGVDYLQGELFGLPLLAPPQGIARRAVPAAAANGRLRLK